MDTKVIVFDLDHTLVGNVSSLCDRDNIEMNIPWKWDYRYHRGVSVDEIVNELNNGLLRNGVREFIEKISKFPNTIMVLYTYSQKDWVVKIVDAMNRIFGFSIFALVLTRDDCFDMEDGY